MRVTAFTAQADPRCTSTFSGTPRSAEVSKLVGVWGRYWGVCVMSQCSRNIYTYWKNLNAEVGEECRNWFHSLYWK